MYKAIIKNITHNKYLAKETRGVTLESKKEEDAILFLEESDAESTLEFLNDTKEDCYTLILIHK